MARSNKKTRLLPTAAIMNMGFLWTTKGHGPFHHLTLFFSFMSLCCELRVESHNRRSFSTAPFSMALTLQRQDPLMTWPPMWHQHLSYGLESKKALLNRQGGPILQVVRPSLNQRAGSDNLAVLDTTIGVAGWFMV